ncbi:MAG TPA: hypothetical protein VIM51_05390 [Desulfosporosinus sp.]
MDERKSQTKINGYIETNLTHDEWHDQFAQWLESRNEIFRGRLNKQEDVCKQLTNGKRKKRITRVEFRTEHQKRVILLARLARAML